MSAPLIFSNVAYESQENMEILSHSIFFLLLEVISLSSHSCHPSQDQLFLQLENVVQKPAPSLAGLLPVKYPLGSHTNNEFHSQV